MKTAIIIGKKSNNEPAAICIEDLPHLFVSWSERESLIIFYKDLLSQLISQQEYVPFELAVCTPEKVVSDSSKEMISAIDILLLRFDNGNLTSRRSNFLNLLRKELLRRKHIRNSLEWAVKGNVRPLIVLVDDVIDLVITHKRQTGLDFLELLRSGPEQHIHFIIGCTRSYRGLMMQMLQYRNEELPSFNDVLMHELVITPENLFFYKRPDELNYTRLFGVELK